MGTRTPKLAWGLCGLARCLVPLGSVSSPHETILILILILIRVKELVPAERLLVYTPTQGWGPL